MCTPRRPTFICLDAPASVSEPCLSLLLWLIYEGAKGELPSSYQQLSFLIERHDFPEDERGPWLRQILADMALRLDKPAEAEQWLAQQNMIDANVNFLAQWADVQLALGQPENVLRLLQPIVKNAASADNSLLLRLALAENTLGGDLWQGQLQRRMTQREQRADTEHASELALYYLDINPQPQRALHWARINWQSAREHNDRKLFERAAAATQEKEKDLHQ